MTTQDSKINIVQILVQAGAVGIALVTVFFFFRFASAVVVNNTTVLLNNTKVLTEVNEGQRANTEATRELSRIIQQRL